MIKIAHCMTSLAGGVGKVVMNYFDNMPTNEYEVHIVTQATKSDEYLEMYISRGYHIHVVPSKKNGVCKNLRAMYRIFKNEEIDIVHCHMTATNFFPLLAAKLAGVKVRISHSHLAEKKNVLEGVLCLFAKFIDTDRFACGQEAGEAIFGKSTFTIIQNAIDLKKYEYNKSVREYERKTLGLSNSKVICHVGRFTNQKNHAFLIDIFDVLYHEDASYKLILIGEGELLENIRTGVKNRGLSSNVLFMGLIDDVNRKLQASDVFILPSRFEGLCLAAIEAQAAGVPCRFSGTVDRRTKINSNVAFVDRFDVVNWKESIKEAFLEARIIDQEKLMKAGFDIISESVRLDAFYKSSLKRR